ncbi:BREX-2 system adenine-specific DNA-methyltransferase PglX [Tessaracoccus lacteus]|uniref:site-specific DNA-methyltransferase (adenine-specific) n=1 Tax=Tessaracoccus lacteus TaxID=3041766 RepID=A0ABY8PZV1_9ACTN|nr:BREX-2 system adenine-specific DNA-methyltransferase PglX [Tessaracoccus sp. T21]WGT47973.1 BREX-2 system adenine-specific DNA-methyltransferase PglX [Tessaracoccus sp. T21]
MIDSAALLADLKAQLKLLQGDLRARAEDPGNPWGVRLKETYAEALRRERTGFSWVTWRDNEVDQAAVAWIVATTFLRFCEDNDLLVGAKVDGLPTSIGWIAGPGDRVQRAEENLTAYFRDNPTHNRRHWLQQGFAVLAAQPAGAALVDARHNPVWSAEISPESATALIAFWRRVGDDGTLVHDFTDPELGTRFLGDLYQDLSEHAKKTFALLQTPMFVEEFILDQTLTPALAEFGPDDLKLIDPACGSGHFLLGAFERLNRAWLEAAPALDAKERVRRAMASIHGVDLNPFAVAIARFRLTVAGLTAAGERSLVGVPAMGFRLAIGDSLLGPSRSTQDRLVGDQDDESEALTFSYDTEDVDDYFGILAPGQYHVVVGNPPYITVKDKALNVLYRGTYVSAAGKYALSAPFMELFFRLAIAGGPGRGAGYVGQITSNSFMKREFGRKLIEVVFAGQDPGHRRERVAIDLTQVIDTSGAYIPGHGTPTVIIVGRRRNPVGDRVRAVLGVRGEPGQPADPARGLVWSEIVGHLGEPGYDGSFVSVTDLDREVLLGHPWSLSGGGAVDLKEHLENLASQTLAETGIDVGMTDLTGEDEVFILPRYVISRLSWLANSPALVEGEGVRDYRVSSADRSLLPNTMEGMPISLNGPVAAWFWRYRTKLSNRLYFGQRPVERGMRWFDHAMFFAGRHATPLTITFAFVATHNHFVLDRGGKVFKQTAPVIKLPEGATEDRHLELLGVLNSSAACFWLHSMCLGKPLKGEEWERRYEYDATKVSGFPLPASLPLERARRLDALAVELSGHVPAAIIDRWQSNPAGSLAQALQIGRAESLRIRACMVFEQEELDWEVYRRYGLLDHDLTYQGSLIDGVALGERAFEVDLARRVEDGIEQTKWFERRGSNPITELPETWPADYRDLVRRRLDLIAGDRSIRLLEKPEFKRRWATTTWESQRTQALQGALLDRLEDPALWRDGAGPVMRSVAELADLLRADEPVRELARALTGSTDPDLAAVIGALASGEAVPFLAAYRHKPSGIEKYRAWQAVWELQRREDAGETVTIPVPPKYSKDDFVKDEYWKARGKLDVPKERFIAYPGVAREGDPTPVLGWAGWDHRDQGLALARDYATQQALATSDDALVPLVAGLVELEPWLEQWHSDIDPTYGMSAYAVVHQFIDGQLAVMGQTRDQVTAWLPPRPTRGRRASR